MVPTLSQLSNLCCSLSVHQATITRHELPIHTYSLCGSWDSGSITRWPSELSATASFQCDRSWVQIPVLLHQWLIIVLCSWFYVLAPYKVIAWPPWMCESAYSWCATRNIIRYPHIILILNHPVIYISHLMLSNRLGWGRQQLCKSLVVTVSYQDGWRPVTVYIFIVLYSVSLWHIYCSVPLLGDQTTGTTLNIPLNQIILILS